MTSAGPCPANGIVTNRKSSEQRGKVQLIDARELFIKMRKSFGEKRKEISPEQIAESFGRTATLPRTSG